MQKKTNQWIQVFIFSASFLISICQDWGWVDGWCLPRLSHCHLLPSHTAISTQGVRLGSSTKVSKDFGPGHRFRFSRSQNQPRKIVSKEGNPSVSYGWVVLLIQDLIWKTQPGISPLWFKTFLFIVRMDHHEKNRGRLQDYNTMILYWVLTLHAKKTLISTPIINHVIIPILWWLLCIVHRLKCLNSGTPPSFYGKPLPAQTAGSTSADWR